MIVRAAVARAQVIGKAVDTKGGAEKAEPQLHASFHRQLLNGMLQASVCCQASKNIIHVLCLMLYDPAGLHAAAGIYDRPGQHATHAGEQPGGCAGDMQQCCTAAMYAPGS